tara:strand:+ start:506 stop:1165 length:660 start_codon:yes stop_codon:yes gene_type:complete
MAKLYYGSGNITIEGSEIRGVEIRYRGAIEIEDKTSDSFVISHQKNGIMVFPIGAGTLSDLFDYTGEFKITSVIVADINGQKVPTSIHRVMDYTELLNTNAEDMTTNSEDLSATHVSGRRVAKTILKQPHINNLTTSEHNTELHLEDGTKYDGYYHIHLADNAAMTGREHTEDSQDLYFNNGKPTKNPSLVPYATIEQIKKRQISKLKSGRSNRNRRRY